jgi:hypothetical protein
LPEESISKVGKVDGVWSACSVVDPRGYVLGFVGDRTRYYGEGYPNVYVSIYDVYRGRLEIRNTGKAHPGRPAQGRPFCFAAGRNAIFFQEYGPAQGRTRATKRQRTWLYDVERNSWKDLKPARQPGVAPGVVEHLDGQDAAILLADGGDGVAIQWVYSFKRNAWAPLPHAGARFKVGKPYGQVAYAARYGVLVAAAGETAVMRPDVGAVNWGAAPAAR